MLAVMVLNLSKVVELLERIAPPELAEPWDNVGLLVEATLDPPRRPERLVQRVLLTIDLTEYVLEEALEHEVELVVSYHPPIFSPLKRLRATRPAERLILRAAAEGLSIYSPHTALDAAPGGINDWLASGLGHGEVEALRGVERPSAALEFKVVIFTPAEHADALRAALSEHAGAGVIGDYSNCSFNIEGIGTFFGGENTRPAVGESSRLERVPEVRMEMVCPRHALAKVGQIIERLHPYEEPAWDVYPLAPKANARTGMGRRVRLAEPAPIESLIDLLKEHLGISALRVAVAERHRRGERIRDVAVCAGSGGSVFDDVQGPELFVTGEMRHHAVLSKLSEDCSVLVCDHTNTERGYLPLLRERLRQVANGAIDVTVSERDREPLVIV
jgi:dinuclear metal center YbgI/SA1388 family protein